MRLLLLCIYSVYVLRILLDIQVKHINNDIKIIDIDNEIEAIQYVMLHRKTTDRNRWKTREQTKIV